MFLKNIKKMKSASVNFHDSASTALIDHYDKTLLDIIDCQKSGFTRKSVVLMLVKIKQFIMIMRTYVLGMTQHVTSDPGSDATRIWG